MRRRLRTAICPRPPAASTAMEWLSGFVLERMSVAKQDGKLIVLISTSNLAEVVFCFTSKLREDASVVYCSHLG